jgi:hypothetical protein
MQWYKWLIFLTLIFFWNSSQAQPGEQTLVEIKAAADAGDPAAQVKLGDRDNNNSEFWYRKAADEGYAPAQGKLGFRLLLHYRMTFVKKEPEYTALGEEAVKWITLAAYQGDKRGQTDMADICLEGKLVKKDLVEAYKWGDLAGNGSMIDPATIMGRGTRDAATMQMTSAQIAEAQQQVAAYVPHNPSKTELPEPGWVKQIKLSGLSGQADRRLAIIAGKTFSKGESKPVKIGGKIVTVNCLEIHENTVLVEIEGLDRPLELQLNDTSP